MVKRVSIVLVVFCSASIVVAYPSSQQAPSKTVAVSFADRFAFGKSIFVKNERGSQIPFDIINSDIQGWGRFTMLNSPEKADFIAEVTSYESGSVRLSSKTDYATPDGKPQQSTAARKDFSAASVTLTVYEGKTRR